VNRSRQIKIDDLVKSLKVRFPVIPAKAGIQFFQRLIMGSNKQFTIKVLPLFRPPHLNPLPLKGERVGVRGSAERKM
jgi:hypothetical protein